MEPYDDFFKKVRRSLLVIFPKARICLFGSAAAQLTVIGSDIDVVVEDTSQDLLTLFRKSEEKLVKVKRFVNVEKIICTVPIIKLEDSKTGLSADIVFNRKDSHKGELIALRAQAHYPEIRPLYFVLKVFLRERGGLDKTKKGGVCSFMLLQMLVCYF